MEARKKAELKNKHLPPERAQKTAPRRTASRESRHYMVWRQLVSRAQPWTLGPRHSLGREQGHEG